MPVVYMATNTVNGKRYIGYTSNSLEWRKYRHFYAAKNAKLRKRMKISRAINKYGEDNFTFVAIQNNLSVADAIALELHLINTLNPEYNTAKGKQKATGAKWTRARRKRTVAGLKAAWTSERKLIHCQRMSRVHKGHTYKLGSTQTDSAKEKIRQAQFTDKAKAIWNENRAKGPKSLSRKVVCTDDGLVFDSASAAARHYGVSRSALIELCLQKHFRKSVSGLHFKYIDT